jgi:hypothetical protein
MLSTDRGAVADGDIRSRPKKKLHRLTAAVVAGCGGAP